LTYIDTLLQAASARFSDLYAERILRKSGGGVPQLKDWSVEFEALLQTIEDQDALVG
jgi:signal recognition particle receptor subunit alpha